ncbi:MAG TPA: hypothetical protein VIH90_06600 [Candidatus Saccharimonadales bacterium]
MGELVILENGGERTADLDATMAALGEDGKLQLNLTLLQTFSYGDNPHQSGYFFEIDGTDSSLGLQHFVQVEGKAPSKNNYFDMARGRTALTRVAASMDTNLRTVPLMAIAMKHGNASGAAYGDDPVEATKKAIMGSNEDSFGSTFMTTFPIDEELAEIMVDYEKGDSKRRIMDVVAAPSITEDAIGILRRIKGGMRMLVNPTLGELSRDTMYRGLELLGDGETISIQSTNIFIPNPTDPDQHMQLWDNPLPTDYEIPTDLLFAEGIGSSSSSNTTTLVKDRMIIGNGVGQQARHRVTELAIRRALVNGHSTEGASFYTDSFFLKRDGPDMLIDAGVLQGFGLRRDDEKVGSEAISAMQQAGLMFVNIPNSVGRGFKH